MQFKEQPRKGEVMGNRIVCEPVPFKLIAKLNEAQKHGKDEDIVATMCAIVGGFVRMEDGTPIDPDEVSQTALTELFQFAVKNDTEGGVSDFTAAQ